LLVHLSNFRPVKRVTDVVEIFDRVQKKIPARLLMIGDGPDRRAAERLACEKGIHDKIHFMGKQDRIHEKLAMADVMLLPSEMESFGLAALEAMACQVVPVASRVGGLPEVVESGVDGFLAAAGDLEAMAARALEVLGDDALLETMGKAARATAQARFCTTRIIPQYEELYRGLLEDRP
jgi:N-acetyl-alpha-D-glucosaminyl L-malate synthase BshA